MSEKILYIIRGVPGSGKSTLAHKLTDNVVEADQFMYVNGEYQWAAHKLNYAHNMCKRTVEDYMIEGRDKIAVANTFIKRKDIKPYLELAEEYGYRVEQKVCKGNYQNIHGVPQETVEKMRQKFQEGLEPLTEGIEDVQKYFPSIDTKTIKILMRLDPTYKGGDQLGKYGKWILRLTNNNLKNTEMKKQFDTLLQRFPDGINPKTGQKFQAPTLLPSIKMEDLYKVPDSLKQYEILKKEIGKPIDAFKTLPELDMAIENVKKKDIPTNELALKRYNLMKKAVQKGLKIVYEDSNWIVGIPETKESSCMFGEDTKWCTTSRAWDYYESYSERGPLYINLNKNNGQLFQFHFESSSFMDEYDKRVNLFKILSENEGLKAFYFQRVDKIFEDKKNLRQYFEYLTDIEVTDDAFTAKLSINDLDIAYGEYSRNRDTLSLKFIQAILNGDSWEYFETYNEYRDFRNETIYVSKNFDDYIKPLNLKWEDIITIYETNGNTSNKVLTEEQITEIYKYMQSDDFYDGTSIMSVLDNCNRYGAEAEAYNDVINGLEENMPLDTAKKCDSDSIFIKMPIDMAKQIVMGSITDVEEGYSPYENWFTQWRHIKGYDDEKFTLYEPQYGYNGFYRDLWNDALKSFAEKIKEIVGNHQEANSVDKEINEVLKIAGVNSLQEMAYPAEFDLVSFSQLPTFKLRIAYCDEYLYKLGAGSSRIAFKVDDEKVLKIAKNRKGIAQNEHEADWGRNNYGVFAEIYEADTDNYTWIEMELARKAKKSDFKRLIGLTFEELQDVLTYIHNEYAPNRSQIHYYNTSKENVEKFMREVVYEEKNDYISRLYHYMTDYQPNTIQDWFRIANWGVVNRDGQEVLVIIDDGLNEDVFNQYYRRK